MKVTWLIAGIAYTGLGLNAAGLWLETRSWLVLLLTLDLFAVALGLTILLRNIERETFQK